MTDELATARAEIAALRARITRLTTVSDEDVERVARIIVPDIWKLHDDIRDRGPDFADWFAEWKRSSQADGGRWWKSIITARAALMAHTAKNDSK